MVELEGEGMTKGEEEGETFLGQVNIHGSQQRGESDLQWGEEA
jgi:hypothetical protein